MNVFVFIYFMNASIHLIRLTKLCVAYTNALTWSN